LQEKLVGKKEPLMDHIKDLKHLEKLGVVIIPLDTEESEKELKKFLEEEMETVELVSPDAIARKDAPVDAAARKDAPVGLASESQLSSAVATRNLQSISDFIPNDSKFSQQWALDGSTNADINLPEAWYLYNTPDSVVTYGGSAKRQLEKDNVVEEFAKELTVEGSAARKRALDARKLGCPNKKKDGADEGASGGGDDTEESDDGSDDDDVEDDDDAALNAGGAQALNAATNKNKNKNKGKNKKNEENKDGSAGNASDTNPSIAIPIYDNIRITADDLDDIDPNADVIVAIVDTGIDYNHSDLKNNMWVRGLIIQSFRFEE
jgi:hypothetical protein